MFRQRDLQSYEVQLGWFSCNLRFLAWSSSSTRRLLSDSLPLCDCATQQLTLPVLLLSADAAAAGGDESVLCTLLLVNGLENDGSSQKFEAREEQEQVKRSPYGNCGECFTSDTEEDCGISIGGDDLLAD